MRARHKGSSSSFVAELVGHGCALLPRAICACAQCLSNGARNEDLNAHRAGGKKRVRGWRTRASLCLSGLTLSRNKGKVNAVC